MGHVQKPPAQGNLCDEHGTTHEPATLEKTIVGTWAESMKGTEWLIAIYLVREHGSGKEKYIFTCWI
jgi:hypothetical protein